MLNEEYRAALLAERASLEPFVDGNPHKQRRLAHIDDQIATLGGNEARAARHETEQASDAPVVTTAPAVEDARNTTPTETATTPRRGRQSKES